jgi:hypothetical protein
MRLSQGKQSHDTGTLLSQIPASNRRPVPRIEPDRRLEDYIPWQRASIVPGAPATPGRVDQNQFLLSMLSLVMRVSMMLQFIVGA